MTTQSMIHNADDEDMNATCHEAKQQREYDPTNVETEGQNGASSDERNKRSSQRHADSDDD